MKFVDYDKNKIKGKGVYKKSDNLILLEEFAESGLECAKVEEWTQKSAGGCAASLRHSIDRYHLNNIDCISRGNEVFLIRKEK